jgi:hypothetical protein
METRQAELELSVIKKIMEDSRRIYVNNGIHYIFWGVLVASALIINYVMLLINSSGKYAGYMWLILMVSGVIADGLIGKYQDRKSKVHTFADRILGSLWLASAISMFIFGFVGTISGAYNPVFICPVISTSLGISYFTSGAIQQIKWLQYLSLGWWAGGIFLFAFPSIHTLLIFALMLIFFQVVPGIILKRSAKKEAELTAIENN